VHRAWRQPAYGGFVGVNGTAAFVDSASLSLSTFGGPSNLEQVAGRMPAAPLTLDPSANPEEGDP
jgi:hypothetical protein